MFLRLCVASLFILAISCGGGSSKKENERTRIVRNIEQNAYTGPVMDFDGTYQGKCKGTYEGQNIDNCDINIYIYHYGNIINFYLEITSGQQGMAIQIPDHKIVDNIVYDTTTDGKAVGNIGKAGVKLQRDKNYFRLLKDSKGLFYFDGELAEEKIKVEAELSK